MLSDRSKAAIALFVRPELMPGRTVTTERLAKLGPARILQIMVITADPSQASDRELVKDWLANQQETEQIIASLLGMC